MATKEFGMRAERADETVLRSELMDAPKGFDRVPNEFTGGKDIFIMKAGTVKGSTDDGGLDYHKAVKILHRNGLRLPKLNEVFALGFVGDNDDNITRIFGLNSFWVNADDELFCNSLTDGDTEVFKFDEKGNLKKLEEEDKTKLSPERKVEVWNYKEFHRHNYPYLLFIRSAYNVWGLKDLLEAAFVKKEDGSWLIEDLEKRFDERLADNDNWRFKLMRGNPKVPHGITVGVPDERAKASVWSNILRRNNHE